MAKNVELLRLVSGCGSHGVKTLYPQVMLIKISNISSAFLFEVILSLILLKLNPSDR